MKIFLTIDGEQLSKTQCTKLFSNILNSYELNEHVSINDTKKLLSILSYHPEAIEKIGCGVDHFDVVQEEMYKHRRFEIVRTDGSRIDFSFVKCIQSFNSEEKRSDQFKDVMRTFRYDIEDQIITFRKSSYGDKLRIRCAITGLNMQSKDAHVDHATPKEFPVLVAAFLNEQNVKIGEIKTEDEDHLGKVAARHISDKALREKWQEYHRKHAVLRMTLDHVNLGQKKAQVDFASLL